MLLTITTTHRPATELAGLLDLDPYDVTCRRFEFGEAMVLFSQFDPDRATMAVLVEPASAGWTPTPSAVAVVLGALFDGVADAVPRPFEVESPMLSCVRGARRLHELFAACGYAVEVAELTAGSDSELSVRLTATVPLTRLLDDLCTVLPRLDLPADAGPLVPSGARSRRASA